MIVKIETLKSEKEAKEVVDKYPVKYLGYVDGFVVVDVGNDVSNETFNQMIEEIQGVKDES